MNKFFKVLKLINLSRENSFNLLIVLSIFGMLFETFSISLIVPFISQILNPELIYRFPIFLSLIETISPLAILKNLFNVNIIFDFQSEVIITGVFLLFIFFTLKFFYLTYLEWIKSKFIFSIYKNTSNLLFERYLTQPYNFYLNNNSSNLITNITKEVEILTLSSVFPFIRLLTELIFIFGIFVLLFIFQPIITFFSIFIILSITLVFIFSTRSILEKWGKIRKASDTIRVKNFQQGINAFEDIKLNSKEYFFYNRFKKENDTVSLIAAKQSWISQLPVYLLELLGVLAIVILVIITIFQSKSFETIIITLALFTGASFKIIPSFNRILQAYSYVKFSEPVTESFINQITRLKVYKNTSEINKDYFNYNSSIKIKNLSFKYSENEKYILKNINLIIKPNTCIGIMGESGLGKSTLAKIIIGFLDNYSGEIKIGEKDIKQNTYSWMKLIGYVSQNTFLTDDTILRNIAFAEEDENIDQYEVMKCINQSKLSKFIKNINGHEHARIGEIGKKLSGGEKQRIGIARALYKKSKILILDEATSALDIDTEASILETLLEIKKNTTIIFISHKKNSLKICDEIYEIQKDSKLVKVL